VNSNPDTQISDGFQISEKQKIKWNGHWKSEIETEKAEWEAES